MFESLRRLTGGSCVRLLVLASQRHRPRRLADSTGIGQELRLFIAAGLRLTWRRSSTAMRCFELQKRHPGTRPRRNAQCAQQSIKHRAHSDGSRRSSGTSCVRSHAVIGVLLADVRRGWHQLVDHARVDRSPVCGDQDRSWTTLQRAAGQIDSAAPTCRHRTAHIAEQRVRPAAAPYAPIRRSRQPQRRGRRTIGRRTQHRRYERQFRSPRVSGITRR